MNKEYKIEIKGTLLEENNSVEGVFCIQTDKGDTLVKIGISRDLLKGWGLDDDANRGNAFFIIGFLITKLKFLSNDLGDYVLTAENCPKEFQDKKEGLALFSAFLNGQINTLGLSR